MDRLTRRRADTDGGKYILHVVDDYFGIYPDCTLGRVVKRLAAYEDTGLTPEEIVTLQERLNENIGAARMWARRCHDFLQADKEGRLVVLENIDDPLSLDGLSLFLQNRADAKGVLNEYDKMLMREASYRLAEAAVAKNATTTGEKRTDE